MYLHTMYIGTCADLYGAKAHHMILSKIHEVATLHTESTVQALCKLKGKIKGCVE